MTMPLRGDFSAQEARKLAARAKDVSQSRRLLSIAAIYDGMNRTEAAKIGGMDRQTLRDWVHHFNAGGPEGLRGHWTSGPSCRLSPAQLSELAAIVEAGPDVERDGVVRWRQVDLRAVIEKRFGVAYGLRAVANVLHRIGFSHISTRPRHPAQDPETIAAFKKNFAVALSAHTSHLPKDTPVEIWFQDEARIGQKNGIVRQWARKGTRPSQPKDQRTANAYIFGAICPARGEGAAIVMPYADTQAMQEHQGNRLRGRGIPARDLL